MEPVPGKPLPKKSQPTLEDVARASGVSTATVSRCLNTPDKVAKKTRESVQVTVQKLGYTPHFGGQVLASNRTNTVGAVIPTIDNAIFARALQAFQQELATAGITLLVASSGYDPEREARQIRSIVSRGADALLLIGSDRPQTTYDFLRQRSIPFVLTWTTLPEQQYPFVGFDNAAAAGDLTRQVLSWGHRSIAMIAGRAGMNDRARERIKGVRQAMDKAGLALADGQLIETGYSLRNGAEAFELLIAVEPKPTAIICGNDVLAVGAISRALDMGLRVPEDISIVGFDDIELAQVTRPQLATVHVPLEQMGKAAAELLIKLKNGTVPAESVTLATHFVQRGSLGQAKLGDV